MILETTAGMLAEHVSRRGVNYQALCNDPRLDAAITAYAEGNWPQSPDLPAYWINAYNLATLDLICRHYPLDSINDLHAIKPMALAVATRRSAWDNRRWRTARGEVSLNTIEHVILRRDFDEPRIHGALVCAARSCPPLRADLFYEETLDAELDAQMAAWLGDSSKNRLDSNGKTLRLSMIFLWYAGDFKRNGMNPQRWAQRYWAEPLPARVKIRYLRYDWRLNDAT